MKKATIMAFLLVALAPVMQVWAGSTYYYKMHLKVSTNSAGKGLVYAKENTTELPSGATFVTETTVTHSRYDNQSVNTGAAFAKANYGYVFKGWSSADNSTTYVSTANPYTPIVKSSATSESKASTSNYYAVFETNPNSYTLTINNPDGLNSYTVTAPSGFQTDLLSHGGEATVYKDDVYTFTYNMDTVGYNFVNWVVNGEEKSSNSVTVTISGNTTIVLILAAKQQFTATCQAAVGGSYKAKVGSTTKTISGSDDSLDNYGSIKVKFSDAVAEDDFEFYGWYKLHANGVKEYLSYYKDSAETAEEFENITVGAEFRRKADVNLNFQPAEGASYTVNGSTTVDGKAYDMPNQAVGSAGVSVALAIASTIDKQPMWWYKADDLSEKIYFSYNKSVTKVFAENAIVGVDLVHSEKSLAKAIEGREGDIVSLSSDAEVVYGTTTTIPAGVTIDLGGHTLYVDGTLVNYGTIQNGTISKCTKLIRQTGNGLAPIVADDISYWDTRIENYTATVPGSSATHLTIINGYGTVIRGTMENESPAAIVCQIDISAGAAVNTITNYVADYSSIGGTGGAILSTGGNTKLVVQFSSSVTLTMSDFPSKSGWRNTKNSGTVEEEKLGKGYRIDCAHNSISVLYEFTNASTTYFINASSAQRTSGYLLSATENFINCANVKQRINVSANNYTPRFNVYDCSFTGTDSTYKNGIFLDGSSVLTTSGCGVNFRSGGPYTIPSTGNSNYHAFGGYYTSKPDPSRVMHSGYKFYQHADNYWYLEPTQDPNVATVDGVKKLYLSEAFEVAIAETEARSKITLLKDCTLQDAVTIPKDIKVRVDLAGCKITAPNGFVVNRGDLEIGDKYGNLSKSGVISESENIFVNENGGKITVAYGKYTGGILLNAGSEFITHHGRFESPLTFGEGVSDKRAVAKLKGGIFSADVTECLSEEYQQNGGYVGFFPEAYVEDDEISGYERAYHLTAFDRDDAQAYEGSVTPYSADWYRRAELQSAIAPYTSYSIDAVLSFDRSVEARSVTVYAKNSQLGRPLNITTDVAANEDYRVMSPQVASQRYYQISYSRFISDKDVKSISCAINDDEGDNRGTTCTIRMDLCSGANKYDISNLTSNYTLAKKSFVFGAEDNVAMLQTAAGADFFATLTAAVASEATTGKTIKLCNDCDEEITVSKACTIDTNGFAFTGEITLGEGYSVSFSDGKYVISMPDPADVLVEKVEVATIVEQVVSADWLEENNIDANTSTETIQEVLKETDNNGNAKWQNLVLGQEADKPVEVKAPVEKGTETTAKIAVSFEVPKDENGDAIDTGYTVKYAFDKTDSAGTVTNVTETVQSEPSLDFAQVVTNTPTYFKMRAVLESDDHSVTNDVPVEKTIGVLKVKSDAEYTILAVPWQSLGDGVDGNISAAELVHAASLSENDELIVDNGDGTTTSWFVNKDGEWTAPTTYTEDEQHNLVENEKVEASTVGIARGKGVWLKRSDTTKDIVLIGQPAADETPVETPIAAATSEDEPTWNLVASPKMEEVDVSTVAGENTSDEIIVPTAGTPKHYTYKDNNWGYSGAEEVTEVTLPGGIKVKVVKSKRETDSTVPAGTGFWYLNKSNNSKTITW